MALNGQTWKITALVGAAALLLSLGVNIAVFFGDAGAVREQVRHVEIDMQEHQNDLERHETASAKTARIRNEIAISQQPILQRLDNLEDAVRELTLEIQRRNRTRP